MIQTENMHIRPILFSISEDMWPDITKATISNVGDMYGNAIRVWGSLENAPADNSYYVSGRDEAVFGIYGTPVLAIDKNNDGIFTPSNTESKDAWMYNDEKNWFRGYYSFAAVLPDTDLLESDVIGTFVSSSSVAIGSDGKDVNYVNVLTLDFDDSGFDLAENQIDLMYAFRNIDNSNENASSVDLNFNHAFAILNIKQSAQSIANKKMVRDLKIYGIHRSISGNLKFRQEMYEISDKVSSAIRSEELSNNMSELLLEGVKATPESPYASFTGAFTTDEEGNGILINKLLVFPETLSEDNPLILAIKYTEPAEQGNLVLYEKVARITTGVWSPGSNYTYKIEL